MIYILLAIIFTTSLFVCFKYFVRFDINTFHAIVINYYAASLTSYIFSEKTIPISYDEYWFRFSAILGLLFILTFIATSITTQNISLIISMIASKMSLVIPISFAVIFIGEKMTILKVISIVLAMTGVLLTVLQAPKEHEQRPRSLKAFLLILCVFLGSGTIDSSFKYIEHNFYSTIPPQFVMFVCYTSAGAFGTICLIVMQSRNKVKITGRSIAGGLILGVLNYFSFIFFLKALHSPSMPGTLVFPLVNVGILLLSTFVAMFFFEEKLRLLNFIGVVISICSIILLAVQHYVL